jgi:hypothetical protein
VLNAAEQSTWAKPLDLRVEGGNYECGETAASELDDPFWCGAMHAWGSNRKIVVKDDASITNAGATVPKACVANGSTFVLDNVPSDPFSTGFSAPHVHTSGGTVIECNAPGNGSNPDCQ